MKEVKCAHCEAENRIAPAVAVFKCSACGRYQLVSYVHYAPVHETRKEIQT